MRYVRTLRLNNNRNGCFLTSLTIDLVDNGSRQTILQLKWKHESVEGLASCVRKDRKILMVTLERLGFRACESSEFLPVKAMVSDYTGLTMLPFETGNDWKFFTSFIGWVDSLEWRTDNEWLAYELHQREQEAEAHQRNLWEHVLALAGSDFRDPEVKGFIESACADGLTCEGVDLIEAFLSHRRSKLA